MARPYSIPDALMPQLFSMLERGTTSRTLIEWLYKEHNIVINVRQLNHRLRPLKKMHLEIAQQAIKEAAARTAVDHVRIMDEFITVLNEEAMRLLISEKVSDKICGKNLADTALKFISKKLDLTGVGDDAITVDDREVLESLRKKIGA